MPVRAAEVGFVVSTIKREGEIWVKFLKEIQIEAVLFTHVSVSKMSSNSLCRGILGVEALHLVADD